MTLQSSIPLKRECVLTIFRFLGFKHKYTYYHSFISARNQRRRKFDPNATAEERLLTKLFRSYDTDARGVIYSNDTVKVTIQLLLLRIQGLVCTNNDAVAGDMKYL